MNIAQTCYNSFMKNRYNHVVVGGTFDHFHKGHAFLLDQALSLSNHITIGITTTNMNSYKLLHQWIQPYDSRMLSVKQHIDSHKHNDQIMNYIAITDVYGNTISDTTIDAIVVTQSTKQGAELINTKRVQAGLKALDIICIAYILDEKGEVISSERIRKGEISREGKRYVSFEISREIVYLPKTLRPVLASPLGHLITDLSQAKERLCSSPMIVSVGDIVLLELRKKGYMPSVAIFDLKSQRKALPVDLFHQMNMPLPINKLSNQAGSIEHQATQEIQKSIIEQVKKLQSIKQPQTHYILIEGEEDLLALPAILYAPLHTLVVYGQKNRGIVIVEVTEEMKEKVFNWLKGFNKSVETS